jgi:hypothetical protein
MTRKAEYKRNRRWDLMALLLVAGFIFGEPKWRDFKESRFYRDYQGVTPFKDVKVFSQVVEIDRIILEGSMIKVRCTFSGLVGFVEFEGGLVIRVPVDTSVEDARGVVGNRPVIDQDQAWGKWAIRYDGSLGKPVKWSIYAQHIGCPDNPINQNNLFAQGKWNTARH